MSDKIPNLDQIPNVLGYMVLDEDQIYMVSFRDRVFCQLINACCSSCLLSERRRAGEQ